MPNHLLTDLAHYTGSDRLFYHPMFRHYVYTEGVQYLAEQAGAYWLLEHIFAHQHEPTIQATSMQVWKIIVHDDKSATIQVENGDDQIIHSTKIEYTDFPLRSFSLWFIDNTLLLPSEY